MEPRTVVELFRAAVAERPGQRAYRRKVEGRWQTVTWSDQRLGVDRISRALMALGVAAGDRVGILSSTRLEWVQCDLGIIGAGAASVGIYPSSLAGDCELILRHAGIEILFVENAEQLEKVFCVRERLSGLRLLVVFEGSTNERAGILSWDDFLARAEQVSDRAHDERVASLSPESLATLVYTSGTTGRPKGAMITHANLVFASWSACRCLSIESRHETLLFLPLAHVFARLIVYVCLRNGCGVAFAEDLSTVPENLREIRPHFIASVPRMYEKVRERILATASGTGLKPRLARWALGVGDDRARRRRERRSVPAWLALRHRLADRLVLRKIRRALGGRLEWAVSGAAPLSVDVGEFFDACGVTILEGYGMTENTSFTNVNRLEHNKLGTVGPVGPGIEMRIAGDGEILFRGPNVMAGYYASPEETAETIDAEGWQHTGDIGEVDADAFLRITDRKKDLIVTAGGKNVAPQRVEALLRGSRFIAQAVAYGDRRKFISALVTLDEENVRRWAVRHGLGEASLEELSRHPDVQRLIDEEIRERNRELASFESVKRFRILPHELTVEAGELTPTLKIKRKVVTEKYRDLLDDIYAA